MPCDVHDDFDGGAPLNGEGGKGAPCCVRGELLPLWRLNRSPIAMLICGWFFKDGVEEA